MNKLEELFLEYCPNGVAYLPLKDICTITKGAQLNKDQLKDEGKYPVINGGINPSGYWEEYNFNANLITISQGGASAGFVNFIETPFWAGAHCYVICSCDQKVDYRFLYHFVKQHQSTFMNNQYGAGIPSLSLKTISELRMPVPPLEVQREIVRVLDSFTLLTAELTAELTARNEQLNFYREKMINDSNSESVKLDTITDIYLGLTATPNYVDSGVKFISAQNTSSDYLDLEHTKFISEEDYRKATSNAKPKRGDLLFTRVGSNLGHPVIVDTDEELCIFVSLGFLRIKDNSKVSVRYLKHWMNTDLFWAQVRKNVHGAAKVNLNTGWLKNFDIPLPSIETQNRIVDCLDDMDRICSDFNDGIPAEISAREKQYAYYRDLLLNFKEMTA